MKTGIFGIIKNMLYHNQDPYFDSANGMFQVMPSPISTEFTEIFLQYGDIEVLGNLIHYRNYPEEYKSIQGFIDPNIPIYPEIQKKLIRDDYSVIERLARNKFLIPELNYIKFAIDRNYQTTPEQQEYILSTFKNIPILSEFANNYHLTIESQYRMLNETDSFLTLRCLGGNTSNDPKIQSLAGLDQKFIPIDPDIQRILSTKTRNDILFELIKNSGVTKETIETLSNNKKFIDLFKNKKIYDIPQALIPYFHPETENPIHAPQNKTLQKAYSSFNYMQEELNEIETLIQNTQKNSPEYNKLLNRKKRKIEDIEKLKTKYQFSSMEELIEKMHKTNPEHIFNFKEKTWNRGNPQSFNENSQNDEKVLLVYPTKELMQKYWDDPLLRQFFLEKPKYAHFVDFTAPIGWALINTDYQGIWIINQIQSDIVNNFNNLKSKLKGEKQPLTDDQLMTIAFTNHRQGYMHVLPKELIDKMRLNPNIMMELPEAQNEEIAQKNMEEYNEKMQRLMTQNIFELKGNETLNQLSEEQMNHIERQLNFIIKDWCNLIMYNVWKQAKGNGVQYLYMNTSDNVSGGTSKELSDYLYESVPSNWGFRKLYDENLDIYIWKRKANIFNLRMIKG